MRRFNQKRSLTQQDQDAWTEFARKVKPLPGCASLPPPEPLLPIVIEPASLPFRPPALQQGTIALHLNAAPPGLDRASWDRLRSGRWRVEATLDLHGHTAHRAHHALENFILHAHATQLRCVEIVTGRGQTGRGQREDTGILRRELPHWLESARLRPLILAATHPPSNPGAVRLLLRRQR